MDKNEGKAYPLISLKESVLLPTEKFSLVLEGAEAVEMIKKAIETDSLVVVASQEHGDFGKIGTLAKIIQSWNFTSAIVGIVVEGLESVRIIRVSEDGKKKECEIENIFCPETKTANAQALARSVYEKFKTMISLGNGTPLFLVEQIQDKNISPHSLSYLVASALKMEFKERLNFLEMPDAEKRLEFLNYKLAKEIEVLKAEKRIQQEVQKEVGKNQTEYILREHMRAIEKELGIADGDGDYAMLEKKIKKTTMPKEIEAVALKELHRLKNAPLASPEAPYIRTYIDWLSELPWNKKSKTFLDIKKAKLVLDRDHYGLEKTKDRVLEHLAVQKLTKGKGRATIMCFVGPPGTGKTSVGKSIARALGREFCRISLGGIRDEAEIRGHRRTYVGALPGRIIQSIHDVGVKNPVFMLDEIDKIGQDFRGDPAAALLEVLDSEQNNAFSDHYLSVPFDLSEVVFIATANVLDAIPATLLDRMETIEFPGYTDEEKFHIAQQFILARVFSSHGLKESMLTIEDEAIRIIIHGYTREAGVRGLERKISEIARKVAKKITEKSVRGGVRITGQNLSEYLGPEEFSVTMREEKDVVGISTGVAWTPSGGEIIFIETVLMPGKGNLILTGQMGKTMQESVKAALSYIRSKSKTLKFDKFFLAKNDIHVHVPSGAVPKDGPSAGVAIMTAIVSVLTGKKVKKEVALTGEITLSGRVLAVGGIKDKVLAAHRAGVEVIILPADNEKDLADIPAEVKKSLKFRFVRHADEVLKYALKN